MQPFLVTDTSRHNGDEILLRQREHLQTTIHLLNSLLHGICQDMRDPLNAILTVPQLIGGDAATNPGDVQNYLNLCRDAGGQILRLVDNLSTWSRLQMGQYTMEPCDYRLDGILDSVLEQLHPMAERHGQRILNHIGDVHVRTDLVAASGVLHHLIENALRFSPLGGVIELSAEEFGALVAVTVSDQGPGIPLEAQPHLFSLDHPHATPDQEGDMGSGFGLLICRALVERMGGAIGLRSRPGHGTQVTFTLPAGTARVFQAPPSPAWGLDMGDALAAE